MTFNHWLQYDVFTNNLLESRLMAMADPMTSCISLPIMAISIMIQSMYRGTLGYSRRQTSARFIPEKKCLYIRSFISSIYSIRDLNEIHACKGMQMKTISESSEFAWCKGLRRKLNIWKLTTYQLHNPSGLLAVEVLDPRRWTTSTPIAAR